MSEDPFGKVADDEQSVDFGADDEMDFEEAFEGASSESESFDDEELDSAVPRLDIGIEGLDKLIQGGVPDQSLMTVIGSPGTGKSTFALHFLEEALQNNEKVVYISLEESVEQILRSTDEKGFGFREAYGDDLALLSYNPVSMANDLESIKNSLPALVDEFGASRLVIDSISLLETMLDNEKERRNQLFKFLTAFKQAGVTTLLTSEAHREIEYSSRYGMVEYLTDAVFHLQHVRGDNYQDTRMSIEIQKIRETNHSRATRPYDLKNDGMKVHDSGSFF